MTCPFDVVVIKYKNILKYMEENRQGNIRCLWTNTQEIYQ